MPEFKPAYLIHGSDHGRIAERRSRLRALAEADGGAGSLESHEAPEATPETVAASLCAMTFAIGRRFVIVDGVERWRAADVEVHLVPVLAALAPETTVAFFAREEGRSKAPEALHEAVRAAGGNISEEALMKEWELPAWAKEHAKTLGLDLDAAAARTLVAQVGDRKQWLARELEKLALEYGPGARLDAEAIAEQTAGSAERKSWSLADALVAQDAPAATRLYLRLRGQGERLEGMLFIITRRLREALDASIRLERGEAAAAVKRTLRMPPRAAEQFLGDVRRFEPAALRQALVALADLQLQSRSGTVALDEDTLAVRTIVAIAGADR